MRDVPGLPKSVVGWIYNHSRKNFWRFASWYEIDDLIQDGIMCAYKCLDRYGRPGIDIDPPHFMKLVQSTFRNHIGNTLRYKRAIDDVSTPILDTDGLDRVVKTVDPEQDFYQLISELPDTLRNVVSFYMTDKGAAELRRRPRCKLTGKNETPAEKLQRLTGFSVDRDFETELRAYIWERDCGLV